MDKTPSIPVLKLCVHLAPESESEGFSIEVKQKKKSLRMVTMKTDLKYGEKSGLRLKIEHVYMIIKPRRRKIHSDSDFRRLRRGEGGSDQSIEISRRRGQQSTKKSIKLFKTSTFPRKFVKLTRIFRYFTICNLLLGLDYLGLFRLQP